ncbi:MAG: hypothetical protein EOO75_17700 [Myxococcales bacterium]|nr:MAG: hypothetical protein EOO75_17700 [Myxococcales bacterium]
MSDATTELSPEDKLFRSLFRELFQTETSASEHCRVEAERLGLSTSPARAMTAVAEQADRILAELPGLAQQRGLPPSAGGKAVGKLFSVLRDDAADVALSMEQSYRGTLLGMRHGMDLVAILERVAERRQDGGLVRWCERWREQRTPLVVAAEVQLGWFAINAAEANAPAKQGVLPSAARAVLGAVGKVETAISGGEK